MIILNVGCGNDKKPGAINIDIREDVKPDMVMDIRYLKDIENNSVDRIYASHVLEHFSHWQVGDILGHWVKKLKTGGTIVIYVPDFVKICEDIGKNQIHDFSKLMRHIYGAQDHAWNYHCVGFSEGLLGRMLNTLGVFVTRVEHRHNYNLIVEGEKKRVG